MPKPSDAELSQIDTWFTYHPPLPEQVEAYKVIRATAMSFAVLLLEKCPASADRTVALRKLRECVAVANASIACGGA